ncbi:TRAP transporter substrate-binding protein [Pseudactinotalea sp. Z1748]|uniref:TRAP transporter substrate-binding protein n=1 Tax=Pseudactinotalea sp. Z1748 TaxID=3413027 RepID=UPI003C7A752C
MSKSLTRRALIATTAAAALVLAGCNADNGGDNGSDNGAGGGNGNGGGGADAEFVLTAGHQLAVDTPFDEGLNRFAELVEEKTEGRVVVETHPNAALGNETEMFQGMQSGTIDVGIIAPGSIGEFAPEMSILSVPFLITSQEQRDAVIEGDIAAGLAENLAETTGTRPLTYFGGSYRQLFFTEPAESLDDIEGRLLRVQPSAVLTDSFAALGLEPTVVAYNELYNALQQGVVEGADNEAVFIDSQKFYEVAPYILRTNHEVTIRPLLVSQITLDNLGEELAALVIEAAEEAGEFERNLEAEVDEEMLNDLGSREGVEVIDVDTSGVQDAVEEVWYDYAEQWDAVETLEQIIALRTES